MDDPITRYQLAEFGALLAEPARAAMCSRCSTAARGRRASLRRSPASARRPRARTCASLSEAGLLSVTAQGRHRYYRLADENVAHWLETFALASPRIAQRKLPALADRGFRARAHLLPASRRQARRRGVRAPAPCIRARSRQRRGASQSHGRVVSCAMAACSPIRSRRSQLRRPHLRRLDRTALPSFRAARHAARAAAHRQRLAARARSESRALVDQCARDSADFRRSGSSADAGPLSRKRERR